MADTKDKHLIIELDDMDSVPRVFYKGKEITKKVRVVFDWSTERGCGFNGSPIIDIEYLVDEREGSYTESIGNNRYFHHGDNNGK